MEMVKSSGLQDGTGKRICKYIEIRLLDILLPLKRAAILPLIEDRCIAISKMAVKASLLCNVFFMDLLRGGINVDKWPPLDLQLLELMYIQGTDSKTQNTGSGMLEALWQKYFIPLAYPPGDRFPLDHESISFSAKSFKTTIDKYLYARVKSKIKLAVKEYLGASNRKRWSDIVLKLITNKNGLLSQRERGLLKEHHDFIQFHRNMLTKPNIQILLRDFELMKQTDEERKNFLLPLNKTNIHHMALTSSTIRGLCQQNNIPSWRRIDDKRIWKAIFNLPAIKKLCPDNQWRFDYFMTTDGFSCCIYFSKSIDCCKETWRAKKNSLEGKTIIGIDPGKRNLVACVELSNDSREIIRMRKLPMADFIQDGGIQWFDDRMRKRERGDGVYWGAVRRLSRCKNIFDYLSEFSKNQGLLWGFHSKKSIREDILTVKSLTKKTIDNFISNLIGGRKNIHVAFGENIRTLSLCDRFECYELLRNPNGLILKAIEEEIGKENVSMICEANTTKICHLCFEALLSDKMTRDDCSRRKKCRNVNCPNSLRFIHKDFNAAANMVNKLILSPIPLRLTKI